MINIFKKKQLKTYKSCKTLWMHNFYEIIDSDDYRWLVKGFDEDSDLELTEKQEVELKELWQTLFNEYVELKGDQAIIKSLRKRALIAELQKRLYWGSTFLQLIIKNPRSSNLDDFIIELKKYKFKFDKSKPINTEVEKLIKQLKSLKTKFNLETSKYEKSLEKSESKEKVDITEQTVSIAKILDLKYPIDSKSTTVSKWIAYQKSAKKIIEDGRKDRHNR